jgi:two-component system response regulator PilR (NtrC family)
VAKILVVDDEQSMREFLSICLRRAGHQVVTAQSGGEAIERLAAEPVDVVVTDLQMPGGLDGLALLRAIKQDQIAPAPGGGAPGQPIDPPPTRIDPEVILVTAFATTDTALAAMKQGAYDYLTKPFKIDEINAVIGRALEKRALVEDNLALRDQLAGRARLARLLGKSRAMQKVFELIGKIHSTRTSVLVTGESGTGKELVARALHSEGNRAKMPFVAVNCGAIPEELMESELFGHKKGAFTGAVEHHDGVFATCSPHGSIFLDEIGDASAAVQVKLLRVLQERTFSPVGSRETRRFRGRVIAATNRSLDELRRPGGLRDDLFYRLCSDVIEMPPLRRRLREAPSELDDLVASVMRRLLGADAPELARLVRATLADAPGPRYPWPGNVRELEQAIRRVLLKGSYAGDRPRAEESPDAGALAERITAGAMDARDVLAAYCAHLYERHGTYEEVARIARLDRRTVRKHVERARGARA